MVCRQVLLFTGGISIAASGKRQIIMDSGQLLWIIIVIVVALVIVGLVVFFGRKGKLKADRRRAGAMREKAETDELGARESEAKAARAEADAQQAEVDAERLRREAREGQEEARTVREASQERVREADDLDPDVDAGGRRDAQAGEGQPGPDGGAGQPGRPAQGIGPG
jgi:flagellar biosynthesis/type III secretory pathway M-ring protein FliF/YscJ